MFLTPDARSAGVWCGDKFREGMSGHWFEKVNALMPFPDLCQDKHIDTLVSLHGDWITDTRMNALGWVLTYPGYVRSRTDVLRLLLELGANPNAVCEVTEVLTEEIPWVAAELAGAEEEALLLLEAGATIPKDSCVLRNLPDCRAHARGVFRRFHQASLRATALVWCLEALRGTSSWPDMSFLLTKIIMDVSK